MNWLLLRSKEELEAALKKSYLQTLKAVALFKHSERCSISRMAKTRLERAWNFSSQDLPVYHIDVLSDRDVSNEIAAALNVKHESPQVLLVKNGKCIYTSSHSDISVEQIKEALNQ